jgi:hypothetical protein
VRLFAATYRPGVAGVHVSQVRYGGPVGYQSGMDQPDLDPEKEQERLDDLGRRIERTRAEADELDAATSHEETFAESGATEEEDDQTIAP